MTNYSGNKGEWSEVYVLFRVLEEAKLFAADENLNKIDSVFYEVQGVTRDEKDSVIEFNIDNVGRNVDVLKDYIKIATIGQDELKSVADRLLEELKTRQGAAYEIPTIAQVLQRLGIETLKAKSSVKSDIRIQVHDINTGFDALQGFSIKSRLGSPSSLINASKSTRFVYEVSGIDESNIQQFNDTKRFKDKFTLLNEIGAQVKYSHMVNDVFENNLMLIDSYLPEICAHLLMEYYEHGLGNIEDALDALTKQNPLGYNMSKGHPFYTYKFKKVLTECALGMLPATTWNGIVDATGGYIIVREDGEVLCYHLFNRNEFEGYLLKNTKFDTPSTSKHDHGYIFEDGGKYYLMLGMMVRFKK
ncbi:MAG: HpaII family restriction endonuclease [Eubacteriales bacterium]